MAGTSRTNWVVEIGELLRRGDLEKALETPTSIFKLPDSVTKDNPKAYSPCRLFLGPFHDEKLNPELQRMEMFKLESAKNAKDKFELPEFSQMVDQLKELEVQIRACYNGNLDVGSEALAWRILIDGLFFLRLLGISPVHKKDKEGKVSIADRRFQIKLPVFSEQQMFLNLEGDITRKARDITKNVSQTEIFKDLIKLENQIPIQILKRVLPENAVENSHHFFFNFCVSVSPLSLPPYDKPEFYSFHPGAFLDLSEILDESQHLLHFLYSLLFFQRFLAYRSNRAGKERDNLPVEVLTLMAKILRVTFLQQLVEAVGLIQTLFGLLAKIHHSSSLAIIEIPLEFPSASELKKVGVKFLGGGNGGGFDKKTATLTLPTITINAFCDVILRNLVAFEVEAKLNPVSLFHYVKLMSGLIDTAKDVRILRGAGIIAGGRSGDEDDVVKMFKELGNDLLKLSSGRDGVSEESQSNFNYELDIIEEINGYYESRWVVKVERFGKKYIGPVFRALLLLVVVVLILIVVIRTICGWFSCPKIMGHSIINTRYYSLWFS